MKNKAPMTIEFTTHDQLYRPPPVKPFQQRQHRWWVVFLLILVFAVGGAWWVKQGKSPPEESAILVKIPDTAEKSVPPGRLAIESQPETELLAETISPVPVNSPRVEPELLPIPEPDPVEKVVEAMPQPTVSANEASIPAPPAAEPAIPQTMVTAPDLLPTDQSITIQLRKTPDSLQMLLGVPRDDRSQALQQGAAPNMAEAEVRVIESDGSTSQIGRAWVKELIDSDIQNPTVVLEFIQMPETDVLMKLMNARLSFGAKLSLVLDGDRNLEYELTIMNARALDSGR